MENYQLKIICLVAVAAFCVAFFFQGGTFVAAFSSVGTGVTVGVLAYWLYWNWLWKIDFILKVPEIYKLKEVVLEFDHVQEFDGVNPAPEIETTYKRATISDCSQHVCDIRFSLHTDEMISDIFAGRFIKDDPTRNKYTLYYMYRTKGKRTEFNDQIGSCSASYDPNLGYWVGRYWTDQLTRGRIHFADFETVQAKLNREK